MRIHWSSSLLIPFIAFRLLAQEAPVNPPAATAAEPPAAVAKPQPPPPPPVPPDEQDVDITSMMMFLKPDSVVMKVGSMDVKWSEVQPWIRFQQQKAQRNNQVLDSKELLKIAAAKGVGYVPGEPFYDDGSVKNNCRINFSYVDDETLIKGVKALADATKEYLAK